MKYLVIAGAKSFPVESANGTDALIDVKQMIRESRGNGEIGPSLRSALERETLNFLVIRVAANGEREGIVCGEYRGTVQAPVEPELIELFRQYIPVYFFGEDGLLLKDRLIDDKSKFFDFLSSL